jgi:flavin-dependent dehydrogenase
VSGTLDLLVVGGGPAGATLAALAADAGLQTLVVERARFPRDKVCGEFLSAEGCGVLRRLGVLDQLVISGAVWIDACRVTHPRGPALDLPLPLMRHGGRRALGLSRRLLDPMLLSRAAAAGARVLQPWKALAPVLEQGRVCGLLIRPVGDESTRELRAKLVVAADGRRSAVGRLLRSSRPKSSLHRPRDWFGLSAHFLSPAPCPHRRIELHLFDGGYAGLGPVENDRLNLGLIVTRRTLRECGGSPDRLVERHLMGNPFLRSTLGEARRDGDWKGVGPLRFSRRQATAAGALFVGDAAGTVDPFCGEGMANAMCGAELALPFVLDAVRAGQLTDEMAGGYEKAWRSAFSPVGRRVRLLGGLLQRQRLARPVLQLLDGIGRGMAPRLLAATRTDWSG